LRERTLSNEQPDPTVRPISISTYARRIPLHQCRAQSREVDRDALDPPPGWPAVGQHRLGSVIEAVGKTSDTFEIFSGSAFQDIAK